MPEAARPVARASARAGTTPAEAVQAQTAIHSAPDPSSLRSPGQPLDPATRGFMESGFRRDLSQVRVHADEESDRSARTIDARAFSTGDHIAFRKGEFSSTPEGMGILAHELAHVVQARSPLAVRGDREAEADADRMSESVLRGIPAEPRNRPAATLSRKGGKLVLKQPEEGEVVVSLSVSLPEKPGGVASTAVATSKGNTYHYLSPVAKVPVGTHQGSKEGGALKVDVPGQVTLLNLFGGDANNPPPNLLTFPATFPVVVSVGKGASTGGGSGPKDSGSGDGGKGGDGSGQGPGSGSGSGAPPPSDKDKSGGGSPDGQKGGVDGGRKDGVVGGSADGGKGGTTGDIPDTVTDVPKDYMGPVVQITDSSQVDDLKAKGFIPAKTADEIKAKLDKKETLTYDQAQALIQGLLAVSEPPDPDKQGRENWLKWAHFVQENKDRISGKSKSGDKGLTVDEVKEILGKYKEFVGVKDRPVTENGKKDFDPAKRKGWNDLGEGEKKLWKDYLAKHPSDFGTSDSTDYHITSSMKLTMALRASPDYVRGGGREALVQMVNDPIFIGGTVVGIGLYIAAWLAPEPIFSKATAAAITTALLTLFTVSEIKNFAVAWMRLSDESEQAQDVDGIETAAENFGKAMGGILARVLVTLATYIAGKLLPGPPAMAEGGPPGGGGGTATAEAVTPNGVRVPVTVEGAQAGNGIKVLADGTIVVVNGAGVMAMAGKGGGRGKAMPDPKGDGKTPAKTDPATDPLDKIRPEAGDEQDAKDILEIFEEGQNKASPEAREADTKAGPRMSEKATPGGKAQPAKFDMGNFSHQYAERLIPPSELPRGLKPEFVIDKPGGYPERLDRVDFTNRVIYEIKPDTPSQVAAGNARLKVYIEYMNRVHGPGWTGKVVTYNKAAALAVMKAIGWIK